MPLQNTVGWLQEYQMISVLFLYLGNFQVHHQKLYSHLLRHA